MIRITATVDGFRRCGIAHTREPVEHSDDKFTREGLKRLQDEPMLVVELIGNNPASAGLNVPKTIELVQAAAAVEELDKLADGETRKGVLDAIAKRRIELAA
jgi:hypothetical protein